MFSIYMLIFKSIILAEEWNILWSENVSLVKILVEVLCRMKHEGIALGTTLADTCQIIGIGYKPVYRLQHFLGKLNK